MPFDQEALAQKYQLTKHRIISSTQIASRTTTIVSKLTHPATEGEKPVIVALTAEARVASKLISVVEIAKRDLASKGGECFQYTALSSRIGEVPRERKVKGGGRAVNQPGEDDGGADEEGDGDFQTMPDPMGVMKKRNTPVMTIYLSSVAVKELRVAYGEQRQS
ncbi:hypothetical protein LTR91_000289 [Friedmanniomyces endolithicus]|uniref:DNA/RNA-binding protein Alba-like domain-containing protein n=1 Tax=Friedmanniomyces endolithicus TaxID=329885 RepID=A0A4U0VJF8_9PEZI|nr:hypothetical protein LTS09_009040 [Friedmanniomyces endolithicus]KAK0281118.1 hypothetical protein LTR35_007492 [Friedmanniomyces endolithicus]KAK0295080.1 hypothetical protein LTS00_006136 [Friedmanniomyces endolithicus]KAK0313803.1 hypothetical protein LTR01_002060 [Friedmanniomyces endolithicus]KAK0317365.1 hypothetical protein LTR82_011688 [Friedmanniomyces endolithicus]